MVDKSWPGCNQITKKHLTTHARPKRQQIKQHIPSSQLLSRKITEIYMITTNLGSPTHSGATTLKEHTPGPFTGFTMSTMIKQSRIHHWIMFFVRLKFKIKVLVVEKNPSTVSSVPTLKPLSFQYMLILQTQKCRPLKMSPVAD